MAATFVSAQRAKAVFSECRSREFWSAAIVSKAESPRNAACKLFTNSFPTPCALSQRIEDFVDIRFISSLTAHDESRFAPVLLETLADLLSKLPISYVVRIETTDGKIVQRSRTGPEPARSTPTRRDDSSPGHQHTSREKVEDLGSL
jgi:hypothetical protein